LKLVVNLGAQTIVIKLVELLEEAVMKLSWLFDELQYPLVLVLVDVP